MSLADPSFVQNVCSQVYTLIKGTNAKQPAFPQFSHYSEHTPSGTCAKKRNKFGGRQIRQNWSTEGRTFSHVLKPCEILRVKNALINTAYCGSVVVVATQPGNVTQNSIVQTSNVFHIVQYVRRELFTNPYSTNMCTVLRGSADNSLARPTSRCRRTESIVSLERRVLFMCRIASLFLFESKRKHVRRRVRFQQHRDASCHQGFFSPCKARRRRKFTPF